jgi:hypothetical protein
MSTAFIEIQKQKIIQGQIKFIPGNYRLEKKQITNVKKKLRLRNIQKQMHADAGKIRIAT